MEFQLYYKNNTSDKLIGYRKLCVEIAQTTLKYLKKPGNYTVSLTIVNDQEIHEINKKYRKIDRPTDVISFAFNDTADRIVGQPKSLPTDLGDIIISLQTAKSQADQYNHSLKRELSFLYLHGLLHLLGYDHQDATHEKEMFALQEKILAKLDINRKG